MFQFNEQRCTQWHRSTDTDSSKSLRRRWWRRRCRAKWCVWCFGWAKGGKVRGEEYPSCSECGNLVSCLQVSPWRKGLEGVPRIYPRIAPNQLLPCFQEQLHDLNADAQFINCMVETSLAQPVFSLFLMTQCFRGRGTAPASHLCKLAVKMFRSLCPWMWRGLVQRYATRINVQALKAHPVRCRSLATLCTTGTSRTWDPCKTVDILQSIWKWIGPCTVMRPLPEGICIADLELNYVRHNIDSELSTENGKTPLRFPFDC